MTDKPIIFSAPMIRALLDGRKTQTRRVLKPQPFSNVHPSKVNTVGDADEWERVRFPYAPGDRLWVREAWAPLSALTHNDPGTAALADNGFYRADNGAVDGEISRWRSPIHMPRWASRLTLAVTDVRVQRVQEISEADAIAEGADRLGGSGWNRFSFDIGGGWVNAPTAHEAFALLWYSIHGHKAWDANPWVCAISFTVERRNIDAPTTDEATTQNRRP